VLDSEGEVQHQEAEGLCQDKLRESQALAPQMNPNARRTTQRPRA